MAEQKKFQNVTIDQVSKVWFVEGVNTEVEFPKDDWDMEVTFTRKVKPVPAGVYVRTTSDLTYYKDRAAGWRIAETGSMAVRQDDEWYRKNAKPLVLGEWDTV